MDDSGFWRGMLESTAGEWVMILSFVFGGCCSNVWALEAVLKGHPRSGTFLTFSQFVYVTIQNLSSQLYFPPSASASKQSRWLRLPRWRKNEVPLRRWMVQVVLFLGVSLMNNYAFGLKIPVTVHIIFRSGGLCVSMLTGWLMAGKRYSTGQVLAGIIITLGIVLATISAPRRPTSPKPASSPSIAITSASPADGWSDTAQYFAGIGLLSLALFVSAWLGLWQEQTYKMYGKKWREGLFYMHLLSLPFFLPLYPALESTYTSFAASPRLTLLSIPQPTVNLLSLGAVGSELVKWRDVVVPSAMFALVLNVVTQGFCIRGVNRLTTRVNSTTVNLVLTLRKAASLAISVWYYGSGFTQGLAVGGGMVLAGTMIYSLAPPPVVVSPDKKDITAPDGAKSEVMAEGRGTAIEKRIDETRQRGAKAIGS